MYLVLSQGRGKGPAPMHVSQNEGIERRYDRGLLTPDVVFSFLFMALFLGNHEYRTRYLQYLPSEDRVVLYTSSLPLPFIPPLCHCFICSPIV